MITKRPNVDYDKAESALTLDVSQVTDEKDVYGGTHTKRHASGWTITGEVHEDYFTWVNEFEASHPVHGAVQGDFEVEIRATSEEGFADFMANHPPRAWDYGDI